MGQLPTPEKRGGLGGWTLGPSGLFSRRATIRGGCIAGHQQVHRMAQETGEHWVTGRKGSPTEKRHRFRVRNRTS